MPNLKTSTLSTGIFWISLIVLSLAGILAVLYSTVWGSALADDSYFYISSARNFLAGRGFDLVSKVPPLLPLVLSLIGLFKVDPLISIRWLNAILFGLNILLVAWVVYNLTRTFAFSLLGALFALTSSTLIMVHSWAMSESLFIFFMLLGFLVYSAAYKKSTWSVPLFNGIFFGMAATTRYIGISLLLSGGLLWLTEVGKSNRLRLRNTTIFSISAVIPLLLWIIRNQIITGQPTSRVFSLNPIPKSLWINLLNTIFLWFVPGRLVHGKELLWLGGLIILSVIGFTIIFIRSRGKIFRKPHLLPEHAPVLLICLSIVTYLLILILSRAYFDNRVPMDERLLSPVLVMGSILMAWVFSLGWNRHRWFVYGVVVIFSIVVLLTNLTRSIQMIESYHEMGRGYASARDHISETYAYLRNRADIPVYSNEFAAIYFWTGRDTYTLPPVSGIQAMKEDMKKTGAYLVIFDSIPVELFGVTREELTQGLVEQIRLSEATIYRSP